MRRIKQYQQQQESKTHSISPHQQAELNYLVSQTRHHTVVTTFLKVDLLFLTVILVGFYLWQTQQPLPKETPLVEDRHANFLGEATQELLLAGMRWIGAAFITFFVAKRKIKKTALPSIAQINKMSIDDAKQSIQRLRPIYKKQQDNLTKWTILSFISSIITLVALPLYRSIQQYYCDTDTTELEETAAILFISIDNAYQFNRHAIDGLVQQRKILPQDHEKLFFWYLTEKLLFNATLTSMSQTVKNLCTDPRIVDGIFFRNQVFAEFQEVSSFLMGAAMQPITKFGEHLSNGQRITLHYLKNAAETHFHNFRLTNVANTSRLLAIKNLLILYQSVFFISLVLIPVLLHLLWKHKIFYIRKNNLEKEMVNKNSLFYEIFSPLTQDIEIINEVKQMDRIPVATLVLTGNTILLQILKQLPELRPCFTTTYTLSYNLLDYKILQLQSAKHTLNLTLNALHFMNLKIIQLKTGLALLLKDIYAEDTPVPTLTVDHLQFTAHWQWQITLANPTFSQAFITELGALFPQDIVESQTQRTITQFVLRSPLNQIPTTEMWRQANERIKRMGPVVYQPSTTENKQFTAVGSGVKTKIKTGSWVPSYDFWAHVFTIKRPRVQYTDGLVYAGSKLIQLRGLHNSHIIAYAFIPMAMQEELQRRGSLNIHQHALATRIGSDTQLRPCTAESKTLGYHHSYKTEPNSSEEDYG